MCFGFLHFINIQISTIYGLEIITTPSDRDYSLVLVSNSNRWKRWRSALLICNAEDKLI